MTTATVRPRNTNAAFVGGAGSSTTNDGRDVSTVAPIVDLAGRGGVVGRPRLSTFSAFSGSYDAGLGVRRWRGFLTSSPSRALTGFMGSCCVGSKRQHQFLKAGHKSRPPQVGIQPCYSGLQVTGHRYLPT